MAIRTTGYSGSRSNLNSFIKGIASRRQAYTDSDTAYQYSTGQMTPEEYGKYIQTRMGKINQNTTEYITWTKKLDVVNKAMSDDIQRRRYENDEISAGEYAKYFQDTILPRYKEGTPDYQDTILKVNQLNEQQFNDEESAKKKARSLERVQKLYQISELGDDSLAKLRSKMDMFQQIAQDAANDGDEAAYYRALTSFNNTQVSYGNAIDTLNNRNEAAAKKAIAAEKKQLNAELSDAKRTMDTMIANNRNPADIVVATDLYLSKILQAANSGVYDEAGMTTIQNNLNSLGYVGDIDPSGKIIAGEYLGGEVNPSGHTPTMKAIEVARSFNPQPQYDQDLFGASNPLGNRSPLSGKTLAEALNKKGAELLQMVNDKTPILVWNGKTNEYESYILSEKDLKTNEKGEAELNPDNVYIRYDKDTNTATAYNIENETDTDTGLIKQRYVNLGVDPKTGQVIRFVYDTEKNQINLPIGYSLAEGVSVDDFFDLNSQYSRDLATTGEGILATKLKKETEEKAAEEARIKTYTEEQSKINAATTASRPQAFASPAAPAAEPEFARPQTAFTAARASSAKLGNIPFTPTMPKLEARKSFVAPTTLLGMGNIETVAPGYQRIRKADGGFDYKKIGFGNISVDDLAREAKLDKNALLNPNYKFQ
jgi:Tfp pilus assembly major pilin PilA